jgi:hypothetical protein
MKTFKISYLEHCYYELVVEAENEGDAYRLAFKMLDQDGKKYLVEREGEIEHRKDEDFIARMKNFEHKSSPVESANRIFEAEFVCRNEHDQRNSTVSYCTPKMLKD